LSKKNYEILRFAQNDKAFDVLRQPVILSKVKNLVIMFTFFWTAMAKIKKIFFDI